MGSPPLPVQRARRRDSSQPSPTTPNRSSPIRESSSIKRPASTSCGSNAETPARNRGKGALFMPDSDLGPPYSLLFLGAFSFFLAVAGTCTGEAWARFGQVVYRAKEPKQFWSLVAMYYLGGSCLVGYFLYKVYGLSN